MFKVQLEVNNKIIKAEGETILDAFNLLKPPVVIKTYSVLNVKQGKRTARKHINVFLLKRFFANKTLRSITAKQLMANFK